MNLSFLNDEDKQSQLEHICRCCLIERVNMKPIFDACLPEMLMACANVVISNNDGLPTLICFQCVQQLNRAYTFRQQCERSDTMLRSWYHAGNDSLPVETSPVLLEPQIPLSSPTDLNSGSSNSKLELLNVLLDYGDSNLEKSSMLLPIEEPTQVQLIDSSKAIFLQNTSEIEIEVKKNSLTLDDVQKTFGGDVDQLKHLNNDVLMTAHNPTNRISIDSSNSHLASVNAHLPDNDDELINVEFLGDKMPVIPDDYIDLMNSFVTTNPDESEKLIGPSIIGLDKPLEKSKRTKLHIAPESLIACDVCNKKFGNSRSFKRHKKIHRNGRVVICQYCSRQFTDASSLQKHIKRHVGKKPFLCSVCSQTFYEEAVLKVHMRIHTGERPYSCTICCKAFAQSSQLDRHRLTHSEEKPHICDICQRAFTLKWQLKIHARTHTGDKPYACSQCDRKFAQIGNLTMHKRLHTGEKPCVCSDCGKAFTKPFQLSVHRRKHTGEQLELKVPCEKCGKHFASNGSLKIHLRSHSEDRPYTCQFCTQRFKMKAHAVVHMRTHTGERPFKCRQCDKAFIDSSLLKKHSYIHSGEKNYPCSICDKRFTQPGGRLMHERTHFNKQSKITGKDSMDDVPDLTN